MAMNDELRERLLSYLENLEKAAESGADFVIEQAPLYVQELITWEIAHGVLWAVFFLLLCLPFLWLIARPLAILREQENEDGVGGWILTVTCLALIAVWLSIATTHAAYAMKAKIAPRVVIVEKLTESTFIPKGPTG